MTFKQGRRRFKGEGRGYKDVGHFEHIIHVRMDGGCYKKALVKMVQYHSRRKGRRKGVGEGGYKIRNITARPLSAITSYFVQIF